MYYRIIAVVFSLMIVLSSSRSLFAGDPAKDAEQVRRVLDAVNHGRPIYSPPTEPGGDSTEMIVKCGTPYIIQAKIEGHFMNGYGAFDSIRGFYGQQNPNGLKPGTNALVVRTGFNF